MSVPPSASNVVFQLLYHYTLEGDILLFELVLLVVEVVLVYLEVRIIFNHCIELFPVVMLYLLWLLYRLL